jgi:tight adherence protein B
MVEFIIYILILFAIGFILFGISLLVGGTRLSPGEKMAARFRRLTDPRRLELGSSINVAEAARKAAKQRRPILKQQAFTDIPVLDKRLRQANWAQNLSENLRQIKMPVNLGTFMLICFGTGVIGAGIVFLLRGKVDLIFCTVAFLLFGYIPLMYVRVMVSQRVRRFTGQLPDALDLLSSSVRAGLAFTAAIQNVADEMPEPICDEFRVMADELSFNVPLPTVLDHFRARMDTVDVKFFCTAIMIQKEAGGNLAEILDGLQKTIRERFRIYGQIRTLTAQGRMSGWVLGILPIALGLIIYVLNPDYMSLLIKERLGHILLLIAGVMQLVGFAMIRKIVNIKV